MATYQPTAERNPCVSRGDSDSTNTQEAKVSLKLLLVPRGIDQYIFSMLALGYVYGVSLLRRTAFVTHLSLYIKRYLRVLWESWGKTKSRASHMSSKVEIEIEGEREIL